MNHSRKRRTIFLTVLFLAFFVGLPVGLVYLQVRQERLDLDLIAAIKNNDAATALVLLNAGADGNAEDKGNTPVSARQVLMDWLDRFRGRKAPASTTHYPSALLLAQPGHLSEEVVDPALYHPVLMEALVQRGADPNAKDIAGDTALMYAAAYGDMTTARLLLDRGADLRARDKKDNTALLFASASGCRPEDILPWIESGAEVNVRNKQGETPLIQAARYSSPGLVRLFLERGADITATDEYGDNAFSAARKDDAETLLLLRQYREKRRIP